ncbi:MAG TPA: transporter substrate-binding domain-containing protein [Acidimicrobiia bacterium]|nr:transporter substrate-binding domain-containing protein [Acidimicrobiia bacterium]
MTLRKLMALFAVMALALAACGDDGGNGDGEAAADFDTVTEGTLTVCTDAPYPPMEFEDPETGEFTGFDIELMRAIAENLGLDLAVVNTGFDPITSGLAMEAGDCDIAAASITITEERAENIAFTDGYFTADQSLLTLSDSGIESLEDTAGQSVAVQTGTTGELYAQENAPDDTELVSFENPGDVFLALESGQVQAVLQDIIPNQDYADNNEGATVVETYPTDEEYGFAAALEGTEDLIAAVNEQIAALRDDGTYDEIYNEFFPQA